jgi:hypothetical protein
MKLQRDNFHIVNKESKQFQRSLVKMIIKKLTTSLLRLYAIRWYPQLSKPCCVTTPCMPFFDALQHVLNSEVCSNSSLLLLDIVCMPVQLAINFAMFFSAYPITIPLKKPPPGLVAAILSSINASHLLFTNLFCGIRFVLL